jgi:hypothetical protein
MLKGASLASNTMPDYVSVIVGDQLMLAAEVELSDGTKQWRNRFGRVLDGATPAEQAKPAPKRRISRAKKPAAG